MIISEWNQSSQEKNEILNLALKAFGECELTNPDYFDWQYQNNPNGEAVIITVKDPKKNNAIIGVNAFLPMTLINNQKEIQCYLSCNSIVDPNYRGKGIFTQLLSQIPEIFSKKDSSTIYGIPNKNSSFIFSKNHFLEISKLSLLVKPLNLSSYFGFPISQILKPFDFFWKPPSPLSSNIEIVKNEITDDFDELIKKTTDRLGVCHFRNSGFIKWRFLNHPTRQYSILTLKNNSKLIAYVITREMNVFSQNLGVIIDFLTDPSFNDETIFQQLINAALANFWKNGISLVISSSNCGTLENEILQKSGFKTAPSFFKQEQLPLIISTFSNDFENLNNFDEWYFTLGDYDVF